MASSEIDEFPSEDPPTSTGCPDALLQDSSSVGRETASIVHQHGSPLWLRSATVERVAVVAIVLLAIVVRLGPFQRGLGFDELFTAIHFVQTETIWQPATTWLTYNNHVAYSLLARLSVGAFGMHEWTLRLPAFLLGLISLVTLWWL